MSKEKGEPKVEAALERSGGEGKMELDKATTGLLQVAACEETAEAQLTPKKAALE